MASSTTRTRRLTRSAAVITALGGMIVLAVAASAATLGGISVGDLFAQHEPVTISVPEPPPIVSTDFSACQGSLDGWIDESGAEWASHSGNWQCLGNDVVRSQQRRPQAHATVDIPFSTGIEVTTTLERISNQSNRSGAGLALLADGTQHLYVIYERDRGQITIGTVTSSEGDVILDQIGSITDRPSASISASLVGTSLSVFLDGLALGTYDLEVSLTPTQQSALLGNTRFGLATNNDNFSRFDGFTIRHTS